MLNKTALAVAITLGLSACGTTPTRFVAEPVNTNADVHTKANVMYEADEGVWKAKEKSTINYPEPDKAEVQLFAYDATNTSKDGKQLTSFEKEIASLPEAREGTAAKQPTISDDEMDSKIHEAMHPGKPKSLDTDAGQGDIQKKPESNEGLESELAKGDAAPIIVARLPRSHTPEPTIETIPVEDKATAVEQITIEQPLEPESSNQTVAKAPLNIEHEVKEVVLTPEDRILNSTINAAEYQVTPEHSFLAVSASTDRLKVIVDEDQAKAHLINVYYNTDDDTWNDREPVERPVAKMIFKGKTGTLKSNLETLLSHTDGLKLVSDVSDNHRLEYDFEIEGESILEIFDKLIGAFTSPHPLKAKIYSVNKVAYVSYNQ